MRAEARGLGVCAGGWVGWPPIALAVAVTLGTWPGRRRRDQGVCACLDPSGQPPPCRLHCGGIPCCDGGVRLDGAGTAVALLAPRSALGPSCSFCSGPLYVWDGVQVASVESALQTPEFSEQLASSTGSTGISVCAPFPPLLLAARPPGTRTDASRLQCDVCSFKAAPRDPPMAVRNRPRAAPAPAALA